MNRLTEWLVESFIGEEFGAPAGVLPSPSQKKIKKAKKRLDINGQRSVYSDSESGDGISNLKKEAKEESEFFIALNGGLCSSKDIHYCVEEKVSGILKSTFYVYNYVVGMMQEYTEEELFTLSNIGEAIEKKALYKRM